MPFLSLGDFGLYIEQSGEGFPLILISGLSGLAQHWRDQALVLADSFSVTLHDQRGIGGSEQENNACCTIEQLAADVIALMDALGIAQAHIVGHSTGGAIAQSLAIDYPKRVATLVVISGWPKPDGYFRRFFLSRRETLAGLGPQAFLSSGNLTLYPPQWIAANDAALSMQEAQNTATFPKIETMLSRIDAVLGFDRSAELSRIKAPTLVMTAADDIVIPLYLSEALTRAIPGAELKVFPAGGHGFNRVFARDVNQALLRFLLANTPSR